jgi:hypothetical protein
MSRRNLTIARLAEDEIESIEIEDAFGDLLDSLDIAPKVERRAIVTSAQHGDDTRAYIVSVHTVPGANGTTQVYACTCPGFKFHQLYEHREEIRADPPATAVLHSIPPSRQRRPTRRSSATTRRRRYFRRS